MVGIRCGILLAIPLTLRRISDEAAAMGGGSAALVAEGSDTVVRSRVVRAKSRYTNTTMFCTAPQQYIHVAWSNACCMRSPADASRPALAAAMSVCAGSCCSTVNAAVPMLVVCVCAGGGDVGIHC